MTDLWQELLDFPKVLEETKAISGGHALSFSLGITPQHLARMEREGSTEDPFLQRKLFVLHELFIKYQENPPKEFIKWWTETNPEKGWPLGVLSHRVTTLEALKEFREVALRALP